MLIRFSVANFLSFCEEMTLDMLASGEGRHPHHVVTNEQGKSLPLLRAAALYGANAAGKSNLIKAVSFAKDLILDPPRPDQAIAVLPFKLRKEKAQEGSRFEFVVKVDNDIYTYGFVATHSEIREEWLFKESLQAPAKEVKLFERTATPNHRIAIGAGLAKKHSKEHQFFEFIAQGTRPNQLFLNACYERNVDQIAPLIAWFRDTLIVIAPDSEYRDLVFRISKERDFTTFLGSFLKGAGTGIEKITTEELPADFAFLFPEMPDELKNKLMNKSSQIITRLGESLYHFQKRGDDFVRVKLKAIHQGEDGAEHPFDYHEESDGTQRLMHLAPVLFDLKTTPRVYMIDELDRRMHPLLSRFFLGMFLGEKGGFQDGQIIFTCHDTNLLDQDLLRRDEVWFVEKDDSGSSNLYSLAQFKIRHDLKIQKGYLNGRFGAIPFLGDPEILGLAQTH